ncbi:hypothetical protein CKAH01_10422 [Colletotrichum kahawae]|uniref:Secreted protein n=1 Tax=Colletotrichum kahawae TaxID=34407 RepID=A0AAD9XX41_COLKA|nr:hypothetical protein CKAH01_10422 [Colletotrichum kahawae]
MAAATPFDKPPFFFFFPLCIYRVLAHTIPLRNREPSDSRDSCAVGMENPISRRKRCIVFPTSLVVTRLNHPQCYIHRKPDGG